MELTGRKDTINNLSDSRFEMNNLSPIISSSVTRIPGFKFDQMSKRPSELFKIPESGIEYNSNKDFSLSRLELGIPDFSKITSRDVIVH